MLTSFRGNEVFHPCCGGDCCDADCRQQVSTDYSTEAFLDCVAEAFRRAAAGAVEAYRHPSSTTEVSVAVVVEVLREQQIQRCWGAFERAPPWSHVSAVDSS